MLLSDEIAKDLRDLIKADLGSLDPSAAVWDLAFVWVHFRAKRLLHLPRQVLMAPNVTRAINTYPAINKIASELMIGGDVSPWLSDSVRRRKRDHRADLMFNDWQVIHFHLGNVFQSQTKITRTGDVLFAYLNRDVAVFIDIRPHGDWAETVLLEILLNTYPPAIEHYELKGVKAPSSSWSAAEVQQLRRSGVTSPIEIDGRVFMPPGSGLVTSGHALRFVQFVKSLRYGCQKFTGDLGKGNLPKATASALVLPIGAPVRLGLRVAAEELIIWEKSRKLDLVHFPLPQ